MTTTQKVVAGAAIAAALVGVWFTAKTDPPIYIGDGSVVFSHDSITSNSPTQEEAFKHLHKVRTISVIDASGSISQTVPVKNRQWGLISAQNLVRFDFDWRDFGTAVGIVGTCPSPWQGTGNYYVCRADQLTPATLTFTDGQNCPGANGPTCTLCPNGHCMLELEYK
jgi:hypothetical protein